jgi:tetratricopeptide (TPR) repeat protein
MIRPEIEKRYLKICEHTYSQRIKPALDELTLFVRFSVKPEYFYQMEALTDNYKNLLRYAFDGYRDPQQQTILNGICASILGMADEIRQTLVEKELSLRRSEKSMLQALPEEAVVIPSDNPDNLFKQVWLLERLNDVQVKRVRHINGSSTLEWHQKCLAVSALTLSLLHHFDQQKFILLIEFVEQREEQVRQRALTGLIFALLQYDQRIVFYPEILDRLHGLSLDETIGPDVELILLQLLMARETEKITREFEQEVLPEMKKMMPRIEDKLQLGDKEEDDDMEGKNPGWKDMVEEVPGLFEKIEKFSKMQMEGGDVFMSTFQMLKRFDFFNTMSNWFMPFHRDHPDISKAFSDKEEINLRLLESLEKAFYICNSDKYSFALNFQAIPLQQRTMIVTNFEAEFNQMQEMASEEQLLDQSLTANAVYTQYIQDLYRFFKLFFARQEFEDIFQQKIHFRNLKFYQKFFYREGFTGQLASFYFDKNHFYEAIEMYEYIIERSTPSGEYYEKIGYCYQKLGRFKKAIEFYKMAELFDTDRLWILKKLGWCCLKLKDYEQALNHFREAATMQPDDLTLLGQVAQCYLNLKDYEAAEQAYVKLRFFNPDSQKLLRPLAWCHFVLGRLDQAAEEYEELLTTAANPSSYDLMNAAHTWLCLGDRAKALGYYRRSLETKSTGIEELMAAYDEDAHYLIRNGIPEAEIPLIKDYLLFNAENT